MASNASNPVAHSRLAVGHGGEIGGKVRAAPDLQGAAVLAGDVEEIFAEAQPRVGLGAEYSFRGIFLLRAGYQLGSEARGLSLGGGVQYGVFGVDYGFSRLSNDLGNGHTLTVRVEF